MSSSSFTGLAKSFETNILGWSDWINSVEYKNMPDDWESRLTSFEKLLLVKNLRKQNLIDQMKAYIRVELGTEFVSSGAPISLNEVYAESDKKTPIIFILS